MSEPIVPVQVPVLEPETPEGNDGVEPVEAVEAAAAVAATAAVEGVEAADHAEQEAPAEALEPPEAAVAVQHAAVENGDAEAPVATELPVGDEVRAEAAAAAACSEMGTGANPPADVALPVAVAPPGEPPIEVLPPIEPADASTLVPLEEIAPAIAAASLSRRAFLGFGLAVAGGLAGAAGLARLFPVFDDSSDAASPIVPTYDPVGKAWTFVVDTEACIGCGLCVVACKEENHVPEEAAYTRTWIERHVVTADGALYVDSPDAGMNGFPAQSTAPGAAGKAVRSSWFEPRLCMQCENSPCTSVCPVGATYRTEDGVILVDPRRCIGCGYCVVACPYGARYLVPAGENAPNDTPGVADKCTWCYHRISRGAKPACVEVCPVGARRFGDTSDPDGEIATLVRERKPQMLYPEYGTRPRVLYLGPSIEKEA